MSYCVNCGVELKDSEKHCPLCGVVVINPAQPDRGENAARMFPDSAPDYTNVYKGLVAPIAALMLIPLFVTVIADCLMNGALTWSLYVAASIGLSYVLVLFPLSQTRKPVALFITLDCVAVGLFLMAIESLDATGGWFMPLAFPMVVAAWFAALTTASVLKRTIGKLVKTAYILLVAGAFVVFSEILVNTYMTGRGFLSWSLYAAVPCAILAAVALLIHRNKRLKEAMRRRFFI